MRHADLLLPAVQSLLGDAGISLRSLDAIAFGRGPGSFTSLRIGIGVVQGLAWGAGLPVVPISSLAVVAHQAIGLQPAGPPGAEPWHFLVAVDARMNEVFHCTYRLDEAGQLHELTSEAVSAPGRINVAHPERTIGVGNGFERYPPLAELGQALCRVEAGILPSAVALIPLALQWLQRQAPLPAAEAQPVYVRNHVADKPQGT
jgi:tRNA threonylcarbamoyladenosine biosynthesis protein TsaB